jgi:hypothetical protein
MVTGVRWISCSFGMHFSTAKDGDHLFIYLLAIFTSFFENYLLNLFANLLTGLFVTSWSSLYIMEISPLADE